MAYLISRILSAGLLAILLIIYSYFLTSRIKNKFGKVIRVKKNGIAAVLGIIWLLLQKCWMGCIEILLIVSINVGINMIISFIFGEPSFITENERFLEITITIIEYAFIFTFLLYNIEKWYLIKYKDLSRTIK